MKFLADKYYYFLGILAVYFVFNIFFRDWILARIFNTSSDKSITNADAYAKETLIRNILIYSMLGGLALIAILSIVFLLKADTEISKGILISVIALISIFFVGLISIGGFG
jgi:hypothetical protein